MEKLSNTLESKQAATPPEIADTSRRDAMRAIARFSAYVAPATYVLLDSKSAFAQTCSGAQSELDELLTETGGSPRERRRRRREIRNLRRWLQRHDC